MEYLFASLVISALSVTAILYFLIDLEEEKVGQLYWTA